MYDFKSLHVGKDLYRAKSQEEDITITNEITKVEFPVSLKAYGDGPLQLSTDKNFQLFPRLEREGAMIEDPQIISNILNDVAFSAFKNTNVLPLICDEKKQKCNILVFDYEKALTQTVKIQREESGKGRKHPVYKFYDSDNQYICEVRYGGADSNALQRGLWTHTKQELKYFDSLTNGWIDYSHNHVLVKLFSYALVSSEAGHQEASAKLLADIANLKTASGLSV